MAVLTSATLAVDDLKPSKWFQADSPGNDKSIFMNRLSGGRRFKPDLNGVRSYYKPLSPSFAETKSGSTCLEDVEPSKFLLIGNPGTGKSTILNGLIGKPKFKSGISYGIGMTYQLDKVRDGKHEFMDTPGLSDVKRRDAAAEAITKALKQNGHYKIFFVITLQNGRVKPEDVATMNLVLKAAPITHYGIIINQVPPREYREMAKDEQVASHVLGLLCASVPPGKATLHFHLVQRDDDLEGQDNVVKPLPEDLFQFILGTPGMVIASKDVAKVRAHEFEDMMETLSHQITVLQKDNKKMKEQVQQSFRDRDEDLRRFRAQLEAVEAQRLSQLSQSPEAAIATTVLAVALKAFLM